MKNKIVAGMVVLLLTAGCAALMSLEERKKRYGKDTSVITNSYASKQLNPGDTWKIYLKASDPDGDMDSIIAIVDLKGSGTQPVSLTRIKNGDRKELSGYISLSTPSGEGWLNSLTLTLTVQIKDRAGHLSKAVTFPMEFNSLYVQEPPPAGAFQEQYLGSIMITLRSFHDDQGSEGEGLP
jgi:hypothetical protein